MLALQRTALKIMKQLPRTVNSRLKIVISLRAAYLSGHQEDPADDHGQHADARVDVQDVDQGFLVSSGYGVRRLHAEDRIAHAGGVQRRHACL
jgi:hypothetical protein